MFLFEGSRSFSTGLPLGQLRAVLECRLSICRNCVTRSVSVYLHGCLEICTAHERVLEDHCPLAITEAIVEQDSV